jgi:hypothetical protein
MSFSSSLGSCTARRAERGNSGQRVRSAACAARWRRLSVRSAAHLQARVVSRILNDDVACAARQRPLARALRAASRQPRKSARRRDARRGVCLQVHVAGVRHLQQVLPDRRAAHDALAVAVHKRHAYAAETRAAAGGVRVAAQRTRLAALTAAAAVAQTHETPQPCVASSLAPLAGSGGALGRVRRPAARVEARPRSQQPRRRSPAVRPPLGSRQPQRARGAGSQPLHRDARYALPMPLHSLSEQAASEVRRSTRDTQLCTPAASRLERRRE